MFESQSAKLNREHQKKMNEIQKNHDNAMLAKQTQARLQEEEHQKMMRRIEEQQNKVMQTGNIDVLQFSGKMNILGF